MALPRSHRCRRHSRWYSSFLRYQSQMMRPMPSQSPTWQAWRFDKNINSLAFPRLLRTISMYFFDYGIYSGHSWYICCYAIWCRPWSLDITAFSYFLLFPHAPQYFWGSFWCDGWAWSICSLICSPSWESNTREWRMTLAIWICGYCYQYRGLSCFHTCRPFSTPWWTRDFRTDTPDTLHYHILYNYRLTPFYAYDRYGLYGWTGLYF